MPRRYVALRQPLKMEWHEDPPAPECLARTVYEQDRFPQPTGLIDIHGNDIVAIDEAEPIGFVPFSC